MNDGSTERALVGSMGEMEYFLGSAFLDQLRRKHCPRSADEFIEELYFQIDEVLKSIGDRIDHLRTDEVSLTLYVADRLCDRGYNATSEEYVSGHCDIKVIPKHGSYRWLCEGKIHSAYEKLVEGMKQLLTRYASGTSDLHSGFLFFIPNKDSVNVVRKWRKLIDSKNLLDLQDNAHEDGVEAPLSHFRFRSTHRIVDGAIIHVRHMGVPFLHAPEDKSAVGSKKHGADGG